MSERQNATGFSETEKKDDPDSKIRQEFSFPISPIDGPPATVNVMLGLTINQGNYESARIDVGIRMPCNPADVEETYQTAKDWCESRIKIEVKSIRGK
jgi:hypothetical protein